MSKHVRFSNKVNSMKIDRWKACLLWDTLKTESSNTEINSILERANWKKRSPLWFVRNYYFLAWIVVYRTTWLKIHFMKIIGSIFESKGKWKLRLFYMRNSVLSKSLATVKQVTLRRTHPRPRKLPLDAAKMYDSWYIDLIINCGRLSVINYQWSMILESYVDHDDCLLS